VSWRLVGDFGNYLAFFGQIVNKELKEEGKNYACGVKEVRTLVFGLNCI
jgi:hypothetical protein